MIQSIRRHQREKGQGLIEYAMAVLLIIGVFGIIQASIKKTIHGIWIGMAKNIAPGCPGCEPPPEIK